MPAPKNTLYVTGFSRDVKAKQLAPDFEKFGNLLRVDVPPLRHPDAQPYAFVEYEERKDAEAALECSGKPFGEEQKPLTIEWARSEPHPPGSRRGPPPYARYGGYRDDYGPPRRGGYRDDYGPPPRRGGYRDEYDYGPPRRGGYRDEYDYGPPRRGYRDDYGPPPRRGDSYRRDDYRRDDRRDGEYRRDDDYRRDDRGRDASPSRRDERPISRSRSPARDRSPPRD